MSETRPGIRATELWITVATAVGAIAAASAGVLPERWAAIVAGIASVAYAISRGLAKHGVPADEGDDLFTVEPEESEEDFEEDEEEAARLVWF